MNPRDASRDETRLRAGLAVALVVALALRVGLALWGPAAPAISDGEHFDRIAANLVNGGGFGEFPGQRTSHRAPLQALWLAGIRLLDPTVGLGGPLAGAVLGTALVAVVAALARVLYGPRVALVAAALAALYPRFVDYAVRLWSLSEGLFLVLFTGALALWARAERGGSTAAAVAAGTAFGLAALTRPIALAFPVVLVARMGRGRTARVALALLAMVVVLTPWTVRNWRMWGRLVPVSTMGGIVLYQGFHPPAQGWGFTPWREIRAITDRFGGDEPRASAELVRLTMAEIAARPGAALALVPAKLAGLLNPFAEWGERLDLGFLLVLGPGLAGAWRARRDPVALLPLCSLGFVLATALVFYGSPRFRLPAEPVLVVFGAATVTAAWRAGRRRLAGYALGVAALGLLPGLDREHLGQWLRELMAPAPAAAPARAPGSTGSGT